MINDDLKERTNLYLSELRRIDERHVYVEGFSRGVAVGVVITCLLMAAGWMSRDDDRPHQETVSGQQAQGEVGTPGG